MKIFASWSGDLSHKVATHLKTWLEDVLQGSSVWVSSENIEKGSVWFSDVSDTLKDTTFGILCATRYNISAPWLLFEAGALSKGLTSSRVSPLLVDLAASDLKPPLSLLNATLPTEEDMRRLVKTINVHSEANRLPDDRLERAFKRCWPEFLQGFEEILRTSSSAKPVPKKTDRELLEELSDISKSVFKTIQETPFASREAESQKAREMEIRLIDADKRMRMLDERLHMMMVERAHLETKLAAENTIKEKIAKSLLRGQRSVES